MSLKFPDEQLTPHFRLYELRCPCGQCGGFPDDLAEIRKTAVWLEEVRAVLGGHRVHINSGWRCPAHNKAVGGVGGSLHLSGKAADISLRDLSPATVQKNLIAQWGPGKLIRGLGSARGYTHVDRRDGEPAKWRYT